MAGALVLPSAFILWALSWIYLRFGAPCRRSRPPLWIANRVMAVVAQSVIRIGQKVLKNAAMWVLAAAAFLALFVAHAPFPLIVLPHHRLSGGRLRPDLFAVLTSHDAKADPTAATEYHFDVPAPSWGRAVKILSLGLVVWFAPVAGLGWWLGRNHALFQMGVFFSKAACVTFGGAYAVLPYVAQQAVERFGWLSTNQRWA